MDASTMLRHARLDSGLTLRQLAHRAGTSHSTLAAYESGAKTPGFDTAMRVIHAAGFAADVRLAKRHRGTPAVSRGEELAAVLDLAAEFPARHERALRAPVFRAAR